MTVFKNVTLGLAWFWGGFILLTEGAPGFMRMGQGLGYAPDDVLMALFYSAFLAAFVSLAMWAKGLR